MVRKFLMFLIILAAAWMGAGQVWAFLPEGPEITTHYSKNEPASPIALLRWQENLEAVSYEVEVFGFRPEHLDRTQLSDSHLYYNGRIYTNGTFVDLREKAGEYIGKKPLYWRVRALNLDKEPITDFTPLQQLYAEDQADVQSAPLPRVKYDHGYGTTLLYPVYSFIPNPGAVQFEVEVTSAMPENPDGTEPSEYRVFEGITSLTNLYDPEPRIGTYYWRVRGLDADGGPVGVWSQAEEFRCDPEDHWEIGIYGDSISHGGGHLSFGPADWEYSYAHDLDFPVINLSCSGDTSESMVERFDRDVVPFHVKYLLIMDGTNSLRANVSPDDVIKNLKQLQQKCLDNGITPIFLTLPPINPENIKKAFDEDTFGDWKADFAAVNAFIRTQPHIDIAAAFGTEEMPTSLSLDGLHGDWNAKRIMAEIINEHIHEFIPDLPLIPDRRT